VVIISSVILALIFFISYLFSLFLLSSCFVLFVRFCFSVLLFCFVSLLFVCLVSLFDVRISVPFLQSVLFAFCCISYCLVVYFVLF